MRKFFAQHSELSTQHWLLFGALLLTTLGALPLLIYPLGKDQGSYATVGVAILKGGVPYIDAWEIKPPPIYYIYALALGLFGRSPAAIHAIDLVTVPVTAAGLFWLGKRLGRLRVAFLAALMFAVFYYIEHFASLAQSDSVTTLPMTLAVVCAVKAGDHPRASRPALLWSFAAGALCAWTLWFKHYYAFFVLALVVNHALARRGLPVKEGLAFGVGGLLVGGSGLAFLLARGAVGDMLATARGVSQYTASGASLQGVVEAMAHYFAFRWEQWGPVIVLAALWPFVKFYPHLTSRLRSLPTRGSSPPLHWMERGLGGEVNTPFGWRVVILWWMGGLAFLLIQAKGFDTHWIPMLPPLCLLAADSAAVILDRLVDALSRMARLRRHPPDAESHPATVVEEAPSRGLAQPQRAPLSLLQQASPTPVAAGLLASGGKHAHHRVMIAAYALAVLGLLIILYGKTWGTAWRCVTGQESQLDFYRRFQANDVKPAETLQVVAFLKQRVAPGDTLYIWGLRPEVYFLSGLNPATRFIVHFPLVGEWYPAEWKQENVDTLWAAMPPYVLVLQADYMPWVLATNKDSHTLLVEYTALSDWLAYNYERDSQIGDFLIWRRKS